MTDINVQVSQEPGWTTLRLSGELDRAGGEVVGSCVEAIEPVIGQVELDLTDLEFIDSAGIARLMTIHRELELGYRRLVLSGAQGQVRRVLEMTGVAVVVEMT